MKRLFLLSVIVCAAVLSSCGDGETKKLVDDLQSSYDKDGQQVELVGYFGIPRNTFGAGDEISLSLHSVAGQTEDKMLLEGIKLPYGRVPNGFYINAKDRYKGSDIEIYDSEGASHSYSTKFKVTGIVHYTNRDWEKVLNEDFTPTAGMSHAQRVMSANSYEARQKRERENVEKRKADQNGDPNDYSFTVEVLSLTAM